MANVYDNQHATLHDVLFHMGQRTERVLILEHGKKQLNAILRIDGPLGSYGVTFQVRDADGKLEEFDGLQAGARAYAKAAAK